MSKYIKILIFTFIIIIVSISVGCEKKNDGHKSYSDDTSKVWKENTKKQLRKHYIEINNVNMGGFVNYIGDTPDAIHTYYGILILEHLELESEYDYRVIANFTKFLLTETLINNELSDDLYEELHIIYLLNKLNISISKEHLTKISNNLDNYINLHIGNLQKQRHSENNKEHLILQQYISSIYLNYLVIKKILELSVPKKIEKDIIVNFSEVLKNSKESGDDKVAKGIYILSSIDDILNLNEYEVSKESLANLYSDGGFKAHPTEVSVPDIISTRLVLQNKISFEIIDEKETHEFIQKHKTHDIGGYNFYGSKEFSLYSTGETVLVINLLKKGGKENEFF